MTAANSTHLFSPATLGGLLFVVALLWSVVLAGRASTVGGLGWKWWLLVAAVLLSFRWPLLGVPHQMNPDESQLIAGAITLRHDPVFWRSVDGGTAGPVDYYPLLPAAWVDGPASYRIARVIGLIAIFGALFFAGETLARFADPGIARLAVLPALAFQAFTTHPDFIYCSTEVMPVLLLAAAGFVVIRRDAAVPRSALWMAALLLGSVPWGKPQAAPIAVAIWALIAWREIRAHRARSLVPLVAGALVPALVCFALGLIAGQPEHMIIPFLFRNLNYVREAPLSWSQRIALQWWNALTDGYLALWLAGIVIVAAYALFRLTRASPNARRGFGVAALVFVVTCWTVVVPSRPSTHHLLLLMPALMWLAGAALAVAWPSPTNTAGPRRGLMLAAVFVLCAVAPLLVWRARTGNTFAAYDAAGAGGRPSRRQLTELVRRFSRRDEPIAVWGWRCSLYVEAGRRQATRQAQTEAQIYENPLQSYFLRRYFEDVQAANPPVFADAVGPGNFAFEDRNRAHESFPLLRAWIASRYTQIAELDGTRLYVRNDRLPAGEHALPALPLQ